MRLVQREGGRHGIAEEKHELLTIVKQLLQVHTRRRLTGWEQ